MTRTSLVPFVLALLGCSPSSFDSLPLGPALNFEDLTASSGLADVRGACEAVGFADMDGDGAPDLLLPGPGLRVFRNNGAGHFAPWADVDLGTGRGGDQCGLAVEDLDADGRLDVLVGGLDRDVIWAVYNEGGGRFSAVRVNAPDAVDPSGALTAFNVGVLRDEAGVPRVLLAPRTYWGAAPSSVRECRLEPIYRAVVECQEPVAAPAGLAFRIEPGGRRFTPLADDVAQAPGLAQGLAIADLDADGRDDYAVAIDFGTQRAGSLLGDGSFASRTADFGLDFFAHGMGVALGDVDGDGRRDVVITTIGGALDVLPVGPGPRERRTYLQVRPRSIWSWGVLVDDFDDDGRDDVYVVGEFAAPGEDVLRWLSDLESDDAARGADRAFDVVAFRQADGRPLERRLPYSRVAPTGADILARRAGQAVAVADVDGDGQLEIARPALVREGGRRVYEIHLGRLAGLDRGHGLTVRLPARMARSGTRVTVRCGGTDHVREIYGADGVMANARREAHAGCGEAAVYESVRVEGRGFLPVTLGGGQTGRAITIP